MAREFALVGRRTSLEARAASGIAFKVRLASVDDPTLLKCVTAGNNHRVSALGWIGARNRLLTAPIACALRQRQSGYVAHCCHHHAFAVITFLHMVLV